MKKLQLMPRSRRKRKPQLMLDRMKKQHWKPKRRMKKLQLMPNGR